MRFLVPVRLTVTALALLAAAAAEEPLAPGDVLRAALEAQVKGDVEGMLSHFALDRYSTEAVAASRKMLAKAAELASFEDFQLTIRAVSVGESGQMAVVRAQMSYVMNAPDYRAPAVEGVFAVLVKSGNAWKLGTIDPDPLLDEELHAPAEEIPMGKGAPRSAQPVNIKELNERLDKALNGTHLDDVKLAADSTVSVIGKVPGVGDAIANVYQIANVIKDAPDAVVDFKDHGFTRVGFLKAAQVAVGVAQIVTEALPGPDSITDLVAMHLSQMTANAEVRRGLEELRPYLRGPDVRYNPALVLPPEGAYQYPQGTVKATDGGEENHPMGPLMFALVFQSPEALGKPIAFTLAGEVTVPDDLALIAKKMGAVQTANGWRIPLDVTPMLAGPISSGQPVVAAVPDRPEPARRPRAGGVDRHLRPRHPESGREADQRRDLPLRAGEERLHERRRCAGDHRHSGPRRCVEAEGRPGAGRHPGIRRIQGGPGLEAGAHGPDGVPEYFLQSPRTALAAAGRHYCAARREGGIGAGVLRPQLRVVAGVEIARGDGRGQRFEVPGVAEEHAVHVGQGGCGRDLQSRGDRQAGHDGRLCVLIQQYGEQQRAGADPVDRR